MYGLKISLNEGWKTYWHTPGPMGLKPRFDFEGSLNIVSLNVLWPSPKVFGSSGFESIGYENEVILPIKMQAKVDSDPVNLKIKGSIGICYDTCVPIEFETQSGLKTVSKDINTDLLAALANLPVSPSDLGKRNARCSITFDPTGFKIEAHIPYLEKESSNIFFSIKDHPIFKRGGGYIYCRGPLAMGTGAVGGPIEVRARGGGGGSTSNAPLVVRGDAERGAHAISPEGTPHGRAHNEPKWP